MECFVIFVMAWCWCNATESKPQNVSVQVSMTQRKTTMKKLILLLISILVLTNCKKSKEETVEKRIELIPEPDKEINKQTLKNNICDFSEPDTSVSGIKIGNVESVLKVLGKKTKLKGDTTHVFYSKNKEQQLRLTVHAGSAYSQVSIFNVSYSESSSLKIPCINENLFQTEKGIKLGMNKNQIIERLGKCYVAKDSTKESMELYYRIENPKDSKTKLLQNNNMPIYYASYKLKNNKLENFEFGFEYP